MDRKVSREYSQNWPQTSTYFDVWHEYRRYIVLSISIVFFLSRYYIKTRSQSSRLQSLSRTSAPKIEPAASGKAQWLEGRSRAGSGPHVVLAQPKPSKQEEIFSVQIHERKVPKRVKGSKVEKSSRSGLLKATKLQPLIFFSSLTGATERYAKVTLEKLRLSLENQQSVVLTPQIHDLSYIDYDDFFVTPPKVLDGAIQHVYLILLPSYNIDTALDNFLGHLQETHNDFRIDTAPLSGLAGYSVFGFGDRDGWGTESEGFCSQAIDVDRWMAKLTGRKRAFPLGLGDAKSDAPERLEEWSNGVLSILGDLANDGGLGEGVAGSGDALESEDERTTEIEDREESKSRRPGERQRIANNVNVDDVEDLGGKADDRIQETSTQAMSAALLPIDFTTPFSVSTAHAAPKAMVPKSSPTYNALTKQGYTIIGSHSGVKICRWTKSALRGRGSCYKFSFYGIKSHLCMETTPSLSCSNKCVFCWRHGTNPVGTTWRWEVDPPQMIFQGAKEGHYKRIKMMRGVPGVRAERFQEAMKIRHCALSLVGEPIFYPHINEFVSLLHREHISSFLVCNAQHPDQLAALESVTQLYVSIDASNAESLRKIDRPLHHDYWQRFLRCLDILHEKRFRMRTVFRLTLVKSFNIDEEVEGYADLVARGLPCFVEIKGVTYCGTSSSAGAGLTMRNVPFYSEITLFVEALSQALARRGLEYGIAAEHAHSCCVLIASKRFFVDGKWHTLIDYEKFFECLEAGKEFSPEDYMGPPTPNWATWGNGGFDPADERVDRKGKPKAGGAILEG